MIRGTVWKAARLSVVAAALACGGGGQPPAERVPVVTFDTARARVETESDTIPLVVELAETEAQRAHGLMERDSLASDHGMLFLYDRPRDPRAGGFYMWRTRMPLDIAFLDESGRVVGIDRMEPCPNPYPRQCPTHAPEVPYTAALEVPAGWLDRHGVEVGDRVVREDEPEAGDPDEATSPAPADSPAPGPTGE